MNYIFLKLETLQVAKNNTPRPFSQLFLFALKAITAKLTHIWPNISKTVQKHTMEFSIQYLKHKNRLFTEVKVLKF